jgi:regulator of sirC expression with transglutaminase-like and TPR domain
VSSISEIGLVDDAKIELGRAALQLAALDHPDKDLGSYEAQLEALTAEVGAVAKSASTAAKRAAALRTILSDKHDFRGDSTTYDDSANADLISVIDRRRGLPVALAILYVAIARRIGWQADVLNTPGHIVIALRCDGATVIVDPFNSGRQLTPKALIDLMRQAVGVRLATKPDEWEPMQNRAVLVRLLNNQAVRAVKGGNLGRAITLYERLTSIGPEMPQLWWERARIELQLGMNEEARSSLSAMLEITTDANHREQINRALEAVPRSPRGGRYGAPD